jgi:hypothetical protein
VWGRVYTYVYLRWYCRMISMFRVALHPCCTIVSYFSGPLFKRLKHYWTGITQSKPRHNRHRLRDEINQRLVLLFDC